MTIYNVYQLVDNGEVVQLKLIEGFAFERDAIAFVTNLNNGYSGVPLTILKVWKL